MKKEKLSLILKFNEESKLQLVLNGILFLTHLQLVGPMGVWLFGMKIKD
jgi:hypothetical protein